MTGFMVSPRGVVLCGRTVACFNGPRCSVDSSERPISSSRPNKATPTHEDAFSQVLWQMYAAREAGVPTVPDRLPAVTQKDGKMEGRGRVRGRRGGAEGRERWWRPAPRLPPSPSLFSFVLSDCNQNKTKHGSSEEKEGDMRERKHKIMLRVEREREREQKRDDKPSLMFWINYLECRPKQEWLPKCNSLVVTRAIS